MRVALDARSLQDDPIGGVGRTLGNLIPHLAGKIDLELMVDARRGSIWGDTGGIAHRLRAPIPGGAPWLQLAAPRFLKGQNVLFHCPYYGLPYRQPVPMVVSMYDISFEHSPGLFDLRRIATFRLQARHAARTARRILTGAEHIRATVIEHYGVPPERVLVAPTSIDPVFHPDAGPDADDVLDRLGVRRPFVTALGGATRRQLSVAVHAWSVARENGQEFDLVVVGPEHPPERTGLTFLGPVSDKIWAGVLSQASAFVYPTTYEGFGMPALEAIASGTPVVCAPVGALPEVLGEAAEWCDSPVEEEVARSLVRLLADPQRAASLRTAGLARAAGAATWADAAAVHLDAYRQAVDD
jgi:alpha-1,3-rhamnosyl/mannosyltransferase